MSKGRVLAIGSNVDKLELKNGVSVNIGNYLNELVVPVMAVLAAGYEVVLATPNGAKPHLDEYSRAAEHFGGSQEAYEQAEAFFATSPAMTQVRTLRSVIDQGMDAYHAIFIPGGHAPMVDLLQDPDLGHLLRHFHQEKKTTAMICHGPIAALAAMDRAGEFRAAMVAGALDQARRLAQGWQYAGYLMTIVSDDEEKTVVDYLFHEQLQFSVVEALTIAGAEVVTTPVQFAAHVLQDRELITGQNPKSDHQLGAALVRALNQARGLQ